MRHCRPYNKILVTYVYKENIFDSIDLEFVAHITTK